MPLPADYCPHFKQMPRVSKDNSVCFSDGYYVVKRGYVLLMAEWPPIRT